MKLTTRQIMLLSSTIIAILSLSCKAFIPSYSTRSAALSIPNSSSWKKSETANLLTVVLQQQQTEGRTDGMELQQGRGGRGGRGGTRVSIQF